MKSMSTAQLEDQNISSESTVHTYAATRDSLLCARVILTSLPSSNLSRKMQVFVDGADGPKNSLSNGNASAMALYVSNLPVKSGEQVVIKVTGTGVDTAVDIESEMFATDALNALDVARPASPVAGSPIEDLHRSRARLANKLTETIDTRTLSIKDDDGTTELFSLTPSESDGVITLTPQ